MLLLEWSHKNLDSATSHLFFLICIGFQFTTELALKLLRLLSGYSNFSSQPILHLSSQSMYRREHSALLQFCKTTIAASKSFSSLASNIWNSLLNHLSSIPALPAFRRALEHHLFLLAYPDSGAKSGKIKVHYLTSSIYHASRYTANYCHHTARKYHAAHLKVFHLSAFD